MRLYQADLAVGVRSSCQARLDTMSYMYIMYLYIGVHTIYIYSILIHIFIFANDTDTFPIRIVISLSKFGVKKEINDSKVTYSCQYITVKLEGVS